MTEAERTAYRKECAMAFASLGGYARAAKLSPQRRTQIARKAAKARWAKSRKVKAA